MEDCVCSRLFTESHSMHPMHFALHGTQLLYYCCAKRDVYMCTYSRRVSCLRASTCEKGEGGGGGQREVQCAKNNAALKRSNVTATLSDVSNGPRRSRRERDKENTYRVPGTNSTTYLRRSASFEREQRLCERTDIGLDARTV